MKLKPKELRMIESAPQVEELPPKENAFVRFFQLDTLMRNLAVTGGLMLVLVALRNTGAPEAQSVFNALQESAGIEWDESVGKLSFVNSFLPEEIQEVWNETPSAAVYAPLDGEVLHAWSADEPYLLIEADGQTVHASAEGEVLSIAHGVNEERIVRILHEGCETVYGNLESSSVEVGQWVESGQAIGSTLPGYPLAFEYKRAGRSVDPGSFLRDSK